MYIVYVVSTDIPGFYYRERGMKRVEMWYLILLSKVLFSPKTFLTLLGVGGEMGKNIKNVRTGTGISGDETEVLVLGSGFILLYECWIQESKLDEMMGERNVPSNVFYIKYMPIVLVFKFDFLVWEVSYVRIRREIRI